MHCVCKSSLLQKETLFFFSPEISITEAEPNSRRLLLRLFLLIGPEELRLHPHCRQRSVQLSAVTSVPLS